MVRDPSHPDNSHPADQKFLTQIETHGWNVTNIFRREGETGPEWSFSAGLFHSYQHPEIVIFGLELDNMQKIIDNIGSEIRTERSTNPETSITTFSLDAVVSSALWIPATIGTI